MKIQKKQASFSGSWYPESAQECQRAIEQFIGEQTTPLQGVFSGGIVPHAGWFFSGSIACRVIASIAASSPFSGKTGKSTQGVGVDVVLIFGMHMHPASPPCVMVSGGWDTPLGSIDIHESLASDLALKTGIKCESAITFPEENTIELQLPFIKYFFPDAAIVPVGVPPSDVAESIGNAAAQCAENLGLNVVVIGSTDMTHYGANYGFIPVGSGNKALEWVKNNNDRKAIKAMLSMDSGKIISQGIENRSMCCSGAVSATVSAVKKMGAVKGIELDYATSYEKSPGSSFVGYSGILFAH